MKQTLSQRDSSRNSKAAQRPLVILQKDRPAPPAVACGVSRLSPAPASLALFKASQNAPLQYIDRETGELIPVNDTSDSLISRYIRQSAARRLLPDHRVSWCLRRNLEGERTTILKNKESGKAHYAGLISCGKIWECPVCAAKVSNRRREELLNATNQHRAAGGALLFVTFTFSHDWLDNLKDLRAKQKKALNALIASREFKSIKAAHGLIGRIRAQEITHGFNGWHPHTHEIWFLESQNSATIAAIKTRLFQEWRHQCVRVGLGEPNERHGVDVQDGSFAERYISKWGIEDELTRANAKKGKDGGRNPFQLLDDYIAGDAQAGALYVEYVKAFKDARQLSWSKGLKKRFAVVDVTDEELAATQEQNSDRIAVLELEEWRLILKNSSLNRDCRAELLVQAERFGSVGVREYLTRLGFVQSATKNPARDLSPNPAKRSLPPDKRGHREEPPIHSMLSRLAALL